MNQMIKIDLLYELLAFCTKLDAKNEKCITNRLYPIIWQVGSYL